MESYEVYSVQRENKPINFLDVFTLSSISLMRSIDHLERIIAHTNHLVSFEPIKSNVLLVPQQELHSLSGVSERDDDSLNFLFDRVELFRLEMSWYAGKRIGLDLDNTFQIENFNTFQTKCSL